ncbi:MAG: hypothetical protein JF563_01315 [Acidobacteriales bacterium]|nr:hypothetical protein [Terriglobales bacterium]
MELLDRYLQAVRKYLPLRRQDDIIAELRANMESQIEDRESEFGRPLTQGELEDFLRKMGHPMVVASRYQPQQYLIGPTLFPMYLYVLRLAMLWAFIICMIVAAVVTPLTQQGGQAVFDALFRTPGILIQVAAWITLVFAAFDFARVHYPEACPQIPGITQNWNPSSLPPIDKPHASGKPRSFTHTVVEIVFGVLFLGWLLVIPHYPFLLMGPGAAYLQAGPFMLAPAWWTFYWLLIAINIMQIAWKCVALARGTWQWPPRMVQIISKAVGLLPVAFLLTTPDHRYVLLKNAATDQLRYGQTVEQVNQGLQFAFCVVCAIVVLQLAFDIAKWSLETYRSREARS